MAFELPPLPYNMDALEPHMSSETLQYHYGKHHQAYVNKLNDLIKDTDLAKKSLEEIIKSSSGAIFNNSAQIWNHTFFWHSLSPQGGGEPSAELSQALTKQFGSMDNFRKLFSEAAINTFGSGWAWLVYRHDTKQLEILSTSNAMTPLTEKNLTPLLTCDVWEHAYYIDYRNARPDYLKAFWSLVNWKFVEENLKKAS